MSFTVFALLLAGRYSVSMGQQSHSRPNLQWLFAAILFVKARRGPFLENTRLQWS